MALETHDLISFLWSVICKWPVINVTLTNFENSNSKYKTSRVFSNRINEIILALNVCTGHKHQLGTSVVCISAHQGYLCYIFTKNL